MVYLKLYCRVTNDAFMVVSVKYFLSSFFPPRIKQCGTISTMIQSGFVIRDIIKIGIHIYEIGRDEFIMVNRIPSPL